MPALLDMMVNPDWELFPGIEKSIQTTGTTELATEQELFPTI